MYNPTVQPDYDRTGATYHGIPKAESMSSKGMVPLDTPRAEEFLKGFFDQLYNNFNPHETAMILQTIRDRGLDYLHNMKQELEKDIADRIQRIKELDELIKPILANKQ